MFCDLKKHIHDRGPHGCLILPVTLQNVNPNQVSFSNTISFQNTQIGKKPQPAALLDYFPPKLCQVDDKLPEIKRIWNQNLPFQFINCYKASTR